MSRGRSRHQASRRRMYSARQRDLRERRLHAARESEEPLPDDMTAIQIDEASDAEVAVPISMPVRRGATAA
ncbi:MAG: hypothetical protein LC744_02155 [Chloroflexi bacterium]|nr:hypothetical protein [Chloroflexota bacterium]